MVADKMTETPHNRKVASIMAGQRGKNKKPMSTAAKLARLDKAEKKFVKDLSAIVLPVLAKMSPAEREIRIRNAKEYLSSLAASVAKRA